MSKKVVVTGMGVVSPVGNDRDTFWKSIREGRSGIGLNTRFDTSEFKPKISGEVEPVEPEGMSPKEMNRLDGYSIYAIEASDQAWKQSGLDVSQEDPYRCGVIMGSGIGGIDTIAKEVQRLVEKGARRVSPFMIPKGLSNMASGNVAIRLGLQGPNKAIVTACATGNHCIGEGAAQIRTGRADVMVVGGAEYSIVPFAVAGFASMRALSTRNDEPERASRPFDKDRDGFVMGEGAGTLVLESEEHALARGAEILAEFAGMGETCDAFHMTSPTPDGSSGGRAMEYALEDAQLNACDIQYFNAHGTGTQLNEIGEAKALRNVFGDAMPPVSSTKSMTGHLLGAASTVEAIACIYAIRDGILPPSINFDTPDPACEVNIIANTAREDNIAIAMSNSLGFGGHNAAVIFKRYE